MFEYIRLYWMTRCEALTAVNIQVWSLLGRDAM